MNLIHQQKGTIILFALLIMTGIVTISLATGTLIVNELQQSSYVDRAVIAFYASESAVERGLYEARKQNFNTINQTEDVLPNSAGYLIIAQNTERYITTNLAQDQTFQLDLYEPKSLNPLSPAIKSLGFSWNSKPTSWLEVRWLAWTKDGLLNPGIEDELRGEQVSTPGDDNIVNLDVNDYLYKVRITARYNDVNNLEIVAYDRVDPATVNCGGTLGPNSTCAVSVPSRIKIKGLGEYPNNSPLASKQAILVSMPQAMPLSGLYDHVIFSEDPIVKEN